MSSEMYRRQLERKRKDRLAAEKNAGELRAKESTKRAEAAKARQAAAKTTSASTAASKLREEERKEKEAAAAGKSAGEYYRKAARYAQQEADLATKVLKAEQSEAAAAAKKAARAQQQADRQAASSRRALESRVATTESVVAQVMRELPAPKPEKLRILLLSASPEGDLRVGREQKRIRAAVTAALGRDQIELDVRPAATKADLLDGLTGFRPHIVHFSGHSHLDSLGFEDDVDDHHEGVVVAASAFASALRATDDRPLLVLLNSCHSAAQAQALIKDVVPFAIGMADEIHDSDAINYAARFYSSLADGQSIGSAHATGQVTLELDGLTSADLPTLACAVDVDPMGAVLVMPQ